MKKRYITPEQLLRAGAAVVSTITGQIIANYKYILLLMRQKL